MRTFLTALLLSSFHLSLAAQATLGSPEKPPVKAKPQVKISTNYGPIVVELEPEAAPLTCANFLAYVQAGHYKGTIFHRVIDGFMIQGGGNTEDMKEKATPTSVKNEAGRAFKAGLKNSRGTLAMARTSDPDSASAQFYINVSNNESLDWKNDTPEGVGYAVFGRVIEGLENADKIAKVKTSWSKGQASVPDYPVRIRSVELLPKP